VTAPQYFHPDFRFLSPKQRLRRRLWLALACLGVVGIGAAIMAPPSAFKSDAAIAPRDPVSRAETIPTASPVGYAAVDPQPANELGARDIAQKPFCLGPQPIRRKLCFVSATQGTHGQSSDAPRLQRRSPRQLSEAGGSRRHLDSDSRDNGVQEGAEIGASSEPAPQPALAQHTVAERCPDRRLGSAGICTWRLRSAGFLA